MGFVQSVFGSFLSPLVSANAFWAVKLSTGKFLCELDKRFEKRSGVMRSFDWTLDLLDTGDIKKVCELWLFCPPTLINPLGSTARLPIVDQQTAFQFKIATLTTGEHANKTVQSQVIGRVENLIDGDCTIMVWDGPLRAMSTPMRNNIHQFSSWREGIAAPGSLSLEVLGVRG